MTTGEIGWTLVPAPDWGKTAYRATATCPHATTRHIIFGRRETIDEQAHHLTSQHVLRPGCSCTFGGLTIDDSDEAMMASRADDAL